MYSSAAIHLPRSQFGFTIGFHIIFHAITIGLASFLTVLECMWLKTGKKSYNIFALGDCAACAVGDGKNVLPRAQAAHEQASLLAKSLKLRVEGKAFLPEYRYRDYGSLVSLSRYSAVGNLMGGLMGSVKVEGWLAQVFYVSLDRMHQMALYGALRTGLLMLSDRIGRSTEPRLKGDVAVDTVARRGNGVAEPTWCAVSRTAAPATLRLDRVRGCGGDVPKTQPRLRPLISSSRCSDWPSVSESGCRHERRRQVKFTAFLAPQAWRVPCLSDATADTG